jgi:hypothetical protein
LRNQFTFYASFYEAAQMIKNKQNRCLLYDALCRYALDGAEPDMSKLPDSVAVAFITAKPNLDASRKKAQSGKQGGSKPKQTASKPQANESKPENRASEKENEKERENEIEKEVENDCSNPPSFNGSFFTQFWEEFPKKLDRDKAWEAWKQLNPSEGTARKILVALEAWMKSDHWKNKYGEYIFAPRAAAFLTDPGYLASPPKLAGNPMYGCNGLGEAEMEAIRRALEGGSQRQLDEDEQEAIRRMMDDEITM